MFRTHFLFFIIASVLGLSYCSNAHVNDSIKHSRGLAGDIKSYDSRNQSRLRERQIKEAVGDLTLRKALALALMNNPGLRGYSWKVRVREAKILDADQYPNPTLGVEAENILGTGNKKGFNSSEITVFVYQPIKLGGQISKKVRSAKLKRGLAGWDYEAKRIDVLTQTTKAFVNVLTAQERLKLSLSTIRLSRKVYRTVSARVSAGKVSPLDKRKARIALSFSKIALKQSKHLLEESRKLLTTIWGGRFPGFDKAVGKLDQLTPPLSAKVFMKAIGKNPRIARWTMEMDYRRSNVLLEKARKIPDLNLSGGFRFFNETGERAFTLGVSMVLPIFKTNHGNYLSAKYKLAKSREDKRAMRMRILIALSLAYQNLSSAYGEAAELRYKILPEARTVFRATREGYRVGKFNLLQLLDIQRIYFTVQRQYLSSLSNYNKAVADIESLIGTRITTLK